MRSPPTPSIRIDPAPSTIKVAIIGAGPSGLVALKTLLDPPPCSQNNNSKNSSNGNRLQEFIAQRLASFLPADLAKLHNASAPTSLANIHVQATVFEKEDSVGGTFRYRSYKDGSLVSSKFLTTFSDFRQPLNSPDHMTMDEYVDYLERYVKHFNLDDKAEWKFNTPVTSVRRVPLSSTNLAADYFSTASASSSSPTSASSPSSTETQWAHEVTYRNSVTGKTETDVFTHLCICSGLHVDPAVPEIPGLVNPLRRATELSSSSSSSSSKTAAEAAPAMEASISSASSSASSKDTAKEARSQSPSPSSSVSRASTGATTPPSAGTKHETSKAATTASLFFPTDTASLTDAQKRIETLHSSAYKDPSIYTGKSVLIMGTGETGLDMAYFAVKAGAREIVLSTRDGFLSFPAVLENFKVLGITFDGHLPIDTLIFGLFEWSMVNRFVAASRFRWWWSDRVIRLLLWCLTGTEAGCNQWVGELPEERLGRAYTFLNKSPKAMPYINRNWKNRPRLLEQFASYLDPPTYSPDEPAVDMAPFPARVEADGRVIFRDNGRKEAIRMRDRVFKPDVVVYATGYRHSFPFLPDEYPSAADAAACRDIFHPSDPTVAFIGFVRPGVGAIPPISELQSQLWNMVIRGALRPPSPPGTAAGANAGKDNTPAIDPSSTHYNLIVSDPQARVLHGVDHSAYSAQLANDMGAAPYPWQVWWEHGTVVTFVYCFGAAFPTLFRLLGPYKHADAPKIAKTELLETIMRRGVAGNIAMGLIPIIFYLMINMFALSIELTIKALETVAPGYISVAKVEKYLEKRTGSFRAYDDADDLSDEQLLQLAGKAKAERIRKKKFEEKWHKLGFASSKEAEKILAQRYGAAKDDSANSTAQDKVEMIKASLLNALQESQQRRGSEYRQAR